ncbi:MAG: hypothetical protein JO206_08225, partial [Solirubrobacterales bacterium]|nr:hypothetical protein [Solirubrobacterales bacterium]
PAGPVSAPAPPAPTPPAPAPEPSRPEHESAVSVVVGEPAPEPVAAPAPAQRPARRKASAVPLAVLGAGLVGAALLLVAEFTDLFQVRTTTSMVPIDSVRAGAHHSYALIPIAVLAAGMALGVWRAQSRPALLALGLLGLGALLIALLGALPDAYASGLVGSVATHFQSATSRPGTGMYLETLGAIVLIVTCGLGFLTLAPPRGSRRPHAVRPSRARSTA